MKYAKSPGMQINTLPLKIIRDYQWEILQSSLFFAVKQTQSTFSSKNTLT